MTRIAIVAGGMEKHVPGPTAARRTPGLPAERQAAVDLPCTRPVVRHRDWHMGLAAEWVAQACDIPRERQDALSVASHQRAAKATADGAFRAEIAPVEVRDRKGNVTLIDADESIRPDSSMDSLGRLKPAFKPDGTVTAGNAPGLNSGAAALVVAAGDWADAAGHKPMAHILGYSQAAVAPKEIFLAPIEGVKRLLAKTGLAMADFDLVEINEAFAAQVLADGDGIPGWDWTKVNVRGGAVALGHPIGASGARILVTLLHALRDSGGRRGLATACLGGGEAVALAVEML